MVCGQRRELTGGGGSRATLSPKNQDREKSQQFRSWLIPPDKTKSEYLLGRLFEEVQPTGVVLGMEAWVLVLARP